MVEITQRFACPLVVTLGAMVGGVPHTRAPAVTGSTTSSDLGTRLGLGRPTYEGPTGIVGTLHNALDRVEHPSHVAAGRGAPLRRRTTQPQGRTGPVAPPRAGDRHRHRVARAGPSGGGVEERVTAAVAGDAEVVDYVHQLEEEVDRRAVEDLPSGDDLAAEFQRFLREQEGD